MANKERITANEFRSMIKHGQINTDGKRLTANKLEPEFKSLIKQGAFKEEKKKPYNKYGAKKTEYNGVKFDSKKEADYCRDLDYKILLKEVISYEKQVRIRCEVNGKKICDYIIDFIVTYPDRVEYVDVKGFKTPVFNLKKKLVESLHPFEIIII